MVGGHLVFGGVVRCVVDGGVSCCWLVVYVDLYFGGVSDNCQVKKVDSVVFVCWCEFQGRVYVVNVVQDYFWGFFFWCRILSICEPDGSKIHKRGNDTTQQGSTVQHQKTHRKYWNDLIIETEQAIRKLDVKM
jgi:hypothetical protein